MLRRRKVLGTAIALVVGCNLAEGLDFFHPAEPEGGKPCASDDDCTAFNGPCGNYTCNPTIRLCSARFSDEGTACPQGSSNGICDGKGSCVTCTEHFVSNCPTPKACTGFECVANQCAAKQAPEGFDCDKGICDGKGNCVQCTATQLQQCASMAVDCLAVSCDAANRCVNGAPNAAGKDCKDSAAMLDGICDGAGKCVKCVPGKLAKCPMNDACTTYSCEQSACVANYTPQGTGCPNGVCDGKGLCKAACKINGECASNVCSNGLCAPCTNNAQCDNGQYCNSQSGTCKPCDSQQGQCGANQYCDTGAGKCGGKKPTPADCANDYECASNHCSTSFFYCWVKKCCN